MVLLAKCSQPQRVESTLAASVGGQEAAVALDTHDVVLGRDEDGGYDLIGLKKLLPELLAYVAGSNSQVLGQTLEHARRFNLRAHLLPAWYDEGLVQPGGI